jgi:hypothetical protein
VAALAIGLALAALYAPFGASTRATVLAQPFLDISATWHIGGFYDNPIEIQQSGAGGDQLAFWDTRRQFHEGRFLDPTTIVMIRPEGDLVGRLLGESRIEWSDNSFWTRRGPGALGRAFSEQAPRAVVADALRLRFDPAGFQYRVGQAVRVCFVVPGEGRVVLTDVLPDGSHWELVNDVRTAGEQCLLWRPGPEDGRECLRLTFRVTLQEERCFQVVRR